MIAGIVNSELEATIHIRIHDANGNQHDVEAIIDTGFNGFLTLPRSAVADFELNWLCRQDCILGDGNTSTFDVYVALIDWDERRMAVEVEAADTTPLVGMSLLEGNELRIMVTRAGTVSVTAIE